MKSGKERNKERKNKVKKEESRKERQKEKNGEERKKRMKWLLRNSAMTKNGVPLCFVKRDFSHVLRDSTSRCVGRWVGWSVGPLFTFLPFLSFLSLLLLPKCSSNLIQHCS